MRFIGPLVLPPGAIDEHSIAILGRQCGVARRQAWGGARPLGRRLLP